MLPAAGADAAGDDGLTAVMTCPVCRTPDRLVNHVNAGHEETWICGNCPGVLFYCWDPALIDWLYRELDPQDAALR